jgi:hypothetical protein
MSKFFDSMNVAFTENGDKAFATTTNYVLDFFSMHIEHAGGKNKYFDLEQQIKVIKAAFYKAFNEDPEKAIRVLLYRYDMREGQGERYLMDVVLKEIMTSTDHDHDINLSFGGKDIRGKILEKLPELGRWSTLINVLSYYKKDLRSIDILKKIKKGLENKETAALVAKWLPRQGEVANRVRGFLKINPKEYRKLLAQYTTTETLKSAQKWSEIEYSKVPSVCMNRSKIQFINHDGKRFEEFLADVKSGKKKINASVLYPHDCIRRVYEAGTQEQWDALPNLFKNGSINAIPMIDVSGSMQCTIADGVTAMDVALGLGIYISERNESVFKDEVITFSERPHFLNLKGSSLCNKIQMVKNIVNPYNTDFALAFKEILKRAKIQKLSQEDMPEALFVLSDMQFDQCYDYSGSEIIYASLELMKKEFEEAGYKMPVIILWNLRGGHTTYPTTSVERGHILISGYSPNVLKALFNGEDLLSFTPEKYMNDLIMSDRYNIFS